MKSINLGVGVLAGLLFGGSVVAADMPELAKKSNCIACHDIDKKKVGPAWQDVAAKYKGDKGAVASLGAKIIAGGKGVWGTIPMPPNPKMTEAEAKELATFVMGLAK
jgi:cytochrome c